MSSAMQSNPDQSLTGPEQLSPTDPAAEHVCTISPMVAKSQEAFRRELPELLKNRYGQWVAYHGDERLGFGRTQIEIYRECLRRGLKDEDFVVWGISPEWPEGVDAGEFVEV